MDSVLAKVATTVNGVSIMRGNGMEELCEGKLAGGGRGTGGCRKKTIGAEDAVLTGSVDHTNCSLVFFFTSFGIGLGRIE